MAAEAVLSVVLKQLLSKLSSLVQNEIGLLWGLEKDKKKLESNLSVIRAVLHDAEMRQVNEMAVRDWLGKLKDAAYDAEDLVDEFIFEAQGLRKKVRNFCSLSNPLTFRLKMAHKMQKLRKRFDGIAKERNDFHFKVEVVESRPPVSRTRETCSYVIESDVCGRKNEAEKLIHSLINSENEEVHSVISIVGMGGLGKTTLAQLIYNDERVGTHFDLKMWVYVSEDFDVGRLLKEILQSAIKGKAEKLSIDLLHARLRETLSGKKYLLVLDDVWNEEVNEWSKLKTWLKCGGMGSKILATTRSDKVAAIMGTLPAHKLGILSEEDSWTLFETLARPHPNFVSMGKEMVGKCGGLPLAIKTLGGLMSSKTTQSEWESVRNSEFWKPQDYGGGILPALRLSYDHLAPSLKQCFAYCAIIPKGRKVYKDKLVRQWIAQGFIHSDGENDLLEEKGEGYFNELLQRSLFHVRAKTYDLEEPHYNMHDLIHDLLRFIVGAEYSIVEASKKIDPSTEIRHLSSQGWIEQRESKILEPLKICKKLRTVSLSLRHSFDVTVLSSFRCLRVLDLSESTIRYLPNSIDKLKHLRYLDISYTLIKELPESICNLHSLQTLKLGYGITNLPKNMKKMISLRHVEFHRYYPAPKGIGELTCLRTWTTFVVSEDNGAGIEELKGLNQLSGHIHIKDLDNIRNGVCAREANLKAKQYLSALELSWSRVTLSSEEVIENLEPHPNLKRLIIQTYLGLNFPSWMKMLTNLVEIKLSFCHLCEDLPHLWQLPLLESLDINYMPCLKYIVDFDGDHNCKDVFPSLKRLRLDDLRNLVAWSSQGTDGGRQGKERDQQVILKTLRHLYVSQCPKLIRLPCLRLLPSLEYLEIRGVDWDAIEMPTSPSSLLKLIVSDMPNLERWSPQEADGDEGNQVIFHSLGTLKINECPKLVCLPGVLLSAPREADHEQVTFPQLLELEVKKCPRIVHFPHLLPSLKILSVAAINEMLLGWVANNTSLTELSIEGFPEVKCFPEELGPNHGVLHTFKIRDCPKLMSISNQLENLHALKTLVIGGCTDLVLSLPDWGGLQHHQQQQSPPLNSLEKLEISNSCEKQASLPGDGIVLTSLTELRIDSCKNIEFLSDDMLGNLASLQINDCPKVFSSLVSLKNLKSLKRLKISRCPDVMNLLQHAESFTSLTTLEIQHCRGMPSLPESMGALTSLTWLQISNCPGMSSLPESMGDLSSLTDLDVSECPEIRTLPEGLRRLTNLQTLRIFQCPILKRRLQCNEGQDWHKVAHVPYIFIDFENPRDSLSSVGHPSLMHSLKMGCNRFNTKKLLLPSSCSSSPSSSSPPRT